MGTVCDIGCLWLAPGHSGEGLGEGQKGEGEWMRERKRL